MLSVDKKAFFTILGRLSKLSKKISAGAQFYTRKNGNCTQTNYMEGSGSATIK